jgi:hypothetical protein
MLLRIYSVYLIINGIWRLQHVISKVGAAGNILNALRRFVLIILLVVVVIVSFPSAGLLGRLEGGCAGGTAAGGDVAAGVSWLPPCGRVEPAPRMEFEPDALCPGPDPVGSLGLAGLGFPCELGFPGLFGLLFCEFGFCGLCGLPCEFGLCGGRAVVGGSVD